MFSEYVQKSQRQLLQKAAVIQKTRKNKKKTTLLQSHPSNQAGTTDMLI